MRSISKEEFTLGAGKFLESIKKGAVFIYPTDTIYGLGCNATDSKAVMRIREAKKRPKAPFSVIAPSKKWIIQNCEMTDEAMIWLDKLPGPYTLVLKLKNKGCIAKEVAPDTDSLGIRIPMHWTTGIAEELGVPIVTTSVNESGKMFMTSSDDVDEMLSQKVDFMIDEGVKKGRPSDVIFLDRKEEVTIRKRSTGEHYPKKQKI